MELYRRGASKNLETQHGDEDVLEFDLDEEESVQASKTLAIGVYHSQKSYNHQALFTDMLKAWGMQKFTSVEKIGDYPLKIDFESEAEKTRVLDGGPRWHKGDALIVVHNDGLLRPSEIKILTLGLWVRFYDLPPAMMKEGVAKVLGGQLDRFIKMDSRYPGYLRVRVEYPLEKPLQPTMMVKIKGREHMPIILRYENAPFFCFSCGRIGHSVMNCMHDDTGGQEVRYGEEL
jgi:hypothetical protein